MSKIPWYPPGCRPKKAQNSSNSIVGCTNVTETELALFTSVPTSTGRVKGESFIHSKQQPLQYGTKRKHEADQGKKVGKKQKPKPVLDPSRPMRPYTQHKYQPVFTPEELAQKRRIAIEEEAVKKALREKVAQQKIEERWIELGKAICSVTPHDFGIDDLPKVVNYDAFSLDETLANVVNFAKNLNSLVGNETKKTILANTLGFAGALCNVPQRSLVHIDKRVQNTRQLQDELDQKEKEAKARKQLIEQSNESRRRFAEFKEIEAKNAFENRRRGLVPGTLERIDKIRLAVAEEAEKKRKRNEEARIKKENHWIELGAAISNLCMDDFMPPSEDPQSDTDSEISDIVDRGEEIVIAVATFVQSLKSLVGEKTSHETVLAGQNTLAAALCGITTATMNARYSFKNKTRRRVN